MSGGQTNQSVDDHGFFKNFRPLVIVPAFLAALALVVGATLLEPEDMPSVERKRPAVRHTQAPAPQRPSANEFRAWDSDHLPLVDSIPCSIDVLDQDLKIDIPATVGGLERQRLNFRLPPTNFCAWSADGKVLYTKSENNAIIRIDVPNWKITHRARLELQHAPMMGLTLTSEGIVVAFRSVAVDNHRERHIDGKTYIHIDPRTGKQPEIFGIRSLFLLDPYDLQLKKHYNGPSQAIAGCQQSPLLCATDDGQLAKLIDIRDGHVVDKAGYASLNGVPQKDLKPLVCLEELLMSPDGKTLFHRGKMSDIEQTDISAGNFGATRKLTPAGGTVSNLPPQRVTMFMSYDGRYVGVPVSTERHEPGGDGYSVIDTTKDGTDPEEPLYAQRSTAFTFVGPHSRPVTNCGVMFVEPHVRVEYHDLLLPKRHQLGTAFEVFPKANPEAHEQCTLSGSPLSDHVLVNAGGEETAWVELPADQGDLKVAQNAVLQPLSLRGVVPDKPSEFTADRPKDKFDTVQHLRKIPIADGAAIACSPDGSRLYMVVSDGTLSAFDTDTLREIRRVQVGKTLDRNNKVYMTKAGPLVESRENKPRFALLDSETLDAKGGFDLEGDHDNAVVASPFAYAIATISNANDLEVYDVRTGQMIARYTPRQLERSEPEEVNNMLFQKKQTRALTMTDDGKWITCRYRCFHIFSVSEEGLKLAKIHIPPEDNFVAAYDQITPITAKGICFAGGNAFEFPSMKPTTSNLKLPDDEVPLTFARNGLIYCRRGESVDVHVFDMNGRMLHTGPGFENNYPCNAIATLPQRPDRIFTLVDGSLQVADLKTPEQQ